VENTKNFLEFRGHSKDKANAKDKAKPLNIALYELVDVDMPDDINGDKFIRLTFKRLKGEGTFNMAFSKAIQEKYALTALRSYTDLDATAEDVDVAQALFNTKPSIKLERFWKTETDFYSRVIPNYSLKEGTQK
jgi:hypothetical protein